MKDFAAQKTDFWPEKASTITKKNGKSRKKLKQLARNQVKQKKKMKVELV